MVQLSEAEPEIRAALERLIRTPQDRRSYLIVEDTITDRYVQFATLPKTDLLFIDLPRSQWQTTERRAKVIKLFAEVPGTFSSIAVMALVSPDEGAKLAIRVLREVLELEEEADIRIWTNSTFARRS